MSPREEVLEMINKTIHEMDKPLEKGVVRLSGTEILMPFDDQKDVFVTIQFLAKDSN